MNKKMALIIVGTFLIVGLIMGYQHRTQSMKTSVTPTPSPMPTIVIKSQKPRVLDPIKDKELRDVVVKAANAFVLNIRGKTPTSYTISSYAEVNEWILGGFTWSFGVAPEMGFYLAKQSEGNWLIAIDGDGDQFDQWVVEAPDALFGEGGKKFYLPSK